VPQSRLRRARRFAAADRGFSIIEVMVSALIVILLAGAAAKALIATTHASGTERVHDQADGLATQDQERLRGMSDEQLNQIPGAGVTRPEVFNGQTFSVTSVATAEDSTGNSSCATNAAAYYKIASTVSWNDVYDRQTPAVTEESILARPVSGDLLADVKDQTGAWLPGVSVSAASTGQPTQLGSTDINGCIVFAGLAPGSWTVTLTKSGYVDPTGNATPGGTATVNTTGMATIPSPTVYLGQSGSVQATFATASGAGAESDGLSSQGSGSSGPAMTSAAVAPKTDTNVPTTTQPTDPLFPFAYMNSGTASYANNYQEWAGRCPGQEPPAATTPVTTPTTVTVSPGAANVAATVYEPLLKVSSVTYPSTSTQVKPSDIEMKYSSPNGSNPSCGDTWWASIVGTPAAAPAPAAGWLANPGQPYAPSGTLTVCADYNVGGGNYRNASVTSLTNTNFATATAVPAIALTSSSSSGKCNL
jgi:type II secretory pathway pseudopilin PulG